MKVKVMDTGVLNPHGGGVASLTFRDALEAWIKKESPIIKDIKFQPLYNNYAFVAMILYEERHTLKQKQFYDADDKTINDFAKDHDVVKIEHFGSTADEITTVITYREHENEKD